MTTRILSAEFDYLKPATLDEALKILAEKENVRILAGGTDVIVKMKVADMTCDYLMDIKGIDALDYAKLADDGVFHIGALAKLSHLEKNTVIAERYPALTEALHLMASISVRNMGTMAGN
ncbi:MAG: FAD binding domain-containing protein, partial [Clostridiales bacterium]